MIKLKVNEDELDKLNGKPSIANTGAVVLAIIKKAGSRALLTDEITQTVLEFGKEFNMEKIDTWPGPTGLDSWRIRNIVAAFELRGFLKDDTPMHISKEGEAWLKRTLDEELNKSNLSKFWSTLNAAWSKTTKD